MEPTQLQLMLNVVTITGVTSLAAYCYLLKKENRKLAEERKADSSSVSNAEGHNTKALPTAVSLPFAVLSPETPTTPEDIRNFVADSRTRWVRNISLSKFDVECRRAQ